MIQYKEMVDFLQSHKAGKYHAVVNGCALIFTRGDQADRYNLSEYYDNEERPILKNETLLEIAHRIRMDYMCGEY